MNVHKADIKTLANELEQEITIQMDKLKDLGKKAKDLLKKVDDIYLDMTKIAEILEPVDQLIRIQYPEHAVLFDMLMQFKKEKNGN